MPSFYQFLDQFLKCPFGRIVGQMLQALMASFQVAQGKLPGFFQTPALFCQPAYLFYFIPGQVSLPIYGTNLSLYFSFLKV